MALTTGTVLRRGLAKHCPVCGQGHLFRHWLWMLPECPRCGLRFRRVPGHWLGSWFLNVCLVQTVIVLILVIGVAVTYPDTPMVVLTLLAVSAAIATPLVFFPFSRTIWSAIDLAMRPLDFDDGVPPGFELEQESTETALRSPPPGR